MKPFSIILCICFFCFQLTAQWERLPGFGGNTVYKVEKIQGRLCALSVGELYFSEDEGNKWTKATPGIFIKSFTVSPNEILAASEDSFFKSSDFGITWEMLPFGFNGDPSLNDLTYAGGEFYISLGKQVFKLNQQSSTLDEVFNLESIGSDYDMTIYGNNNQLWLAPLQTNVRMTSDGGATWTEFPQFYSHYLAFSGDTTWGVAPIVPNAGAQFIIGDDPTIHNIDFPVPSATQAPDYFNVVDGELYAAFYEKLYRYKPSSAQWDIVMEDPFLSYIPIGILKSGEYKVVNASNGILRKKEQDADWIISNTGFDGYCAGFSSRAGVLTTSGVSTKSYFLLDSAKWISHPYKFEGVQAATMCQTTTGYYALYTGKLLHSVDLVNWTEVANAQTFPVDIESPLVARHDTLYIVPDTKLLNFSTDFGQTWVESGTVPLGNSQLEYTHLLAVDSILYSFTDNNEIFKLADTLAQMESKGYPPVSSSEPVQLSTYNSELFCLLNYNLWVSSDDSLNWVSWPILTQTGNIASIKQFLATASGYFALSSDGKNIYYASETLDTFITLDIGFIYDLPLNATINAIAFAKTNLYVLVDNKYMFTNSTFEPVQPKLFSGRIYIDENNNGTQDLTEVPVQGILVRKGIFRHSVSGVDGYYSIYDIDADTLQPVIHWPAWTLNPPFYITGNGSDTLNFGLVPSFLSDFSIDATANAPFRPGFNNTISITWQNLGIGQTSDVVFQFPGTAVSYLAADPVPDAISGDSLIWHLSNIAPGQQGKLVVNFMTHTDIAIGDTLQFLADIEPESTDEQPGDNVYQLNEVVVGAFDPNDKSVTPVIFTPDSLYTRVPLTYLIRFQNTGNFPASKVIVRDTLSQNLNLSSVEIIAASHPYQWDVLEGRVLEFTFDPISLPDSTNDEAGSHGFIKFRILPSAQLDYGEMIENSAQIYFDFNEPVMTNTVVTTIEFPSNSKELPEKELLILTPIPNPNNGAFKLAFSRRLSETASLQVLDLTGRIRFVSYLPAGTLATDVDLQNISEGIYFIQMKSSTERWNGKLIICRH